MSDSELVAEVVTEPDLEIVSVELCSIHSDIVCLARVLVLNKSQN